MSFRRTCIRWIRCLRHRWVFLILAGVCTLLFLSSENNSSSHDSQHEDDGAYISPHRIKQTDKDALPVRRQSAIFKENELGNYEPSDGESKSGPGENGAAVLTNGNAEEVAKANLEFGFNTFASDKISLDRSVPDTRPSECKNWHYPKKLPTASVVVVFHNEGWSPLLRTVHSVINRSPSQLLKEVLMVDDFSVKEHLKTRLETYIKRFNGKVRLIRNEKREGLIGSRSIGGQNALGDVVIFLDAHCEANVNWLPPLLAPISVDRTTMTVPVIDSIDLNTWAYHPQYGTRGDEMFRGIFDWGLLYKESILTPEEKKDRTHASEPFRSPTHAGGLFAIDRQWFADLGYYDPGLQIWGGENFELSFKVWQCGGSIENVPCSRVGHVYRNRMPYNFGNLSGPVISTNYKRVAEVWMDEYKEYYYRREPFMRSRYAGDLSNQFKVREANKCKSFGWFMENVAYDVIPQYPLPPENVGWGEFQNEDTGTCIDTMGQPVPGTLGVSSCHHFGGNQLFRLNVAGQFACGEWCITERGSRIQTGRCTKGTVNGPWHYVKETKLLKNNRTNLCATVGGDNQRLELAQCDESSARQKWQINPVKIGP